MTTFDRLSVPFQHTGAYFARLRESVGITTMRRRPACGPVRGGIGGQRGPSLFHLVAMSAALLITPSSSRATISTSANFTLEGSQDNANVGWCVGTAGDVNGDGYSDVIIGEPKVDIPFFGTNGGRARVYHGGPNGVDTSSDWSGIGGSLSELGYRVSTAGDVNGDDYDDVIVGAPFYSNGNTTEGGAFVYMGSPSGLANSAAWSREGSQNGARLGHCVSTAGDVNGDGYHDVIVGLPFYTGSLTQQGRVQIFLGGPSGLSTTPHRTIDGSGANDAFGWCVSTAGDVNADGYDDVLISAVYYEGILSPADQGAVFCYYGSASGVDGTADWSDFGSQADEFLGSQISLAGDVNGDGFSDVLLGAGSYDNGQTGEGHVLLYYGSSTGLSTTVGWSLESNQADAYLGEGLSTAGDVNGDGYADIIMGATNYDGGQEDEGMVYVYYGSPSGPGSSAIFSVDADEASAGQGWSVQTAGDVNGDGRSDIIIGTPFFDSGGFNQGRAQVFLATPDDWTLTPAFTAQNNQVDAQMGSSVGFADVNGDGYSDLLAGSWFYDAGQANEGRAYCWLGGNTGITNPADWVKEGDQTNAYLGKTIASAGDVNGDGYEDVVLTAPDYNNTITDEGQAWVYHGSSTGLEDTAAWIGRGQQNNADYGWSASSAGDVNGDGYGDLVVGAPNHTNPQSDEGAALLYLGSAAGLSTTAVIGWEGNQDVGSAGFSVASADVNGDGFSDILSGAPLYDNGQTNEGVVFVFFGTDGELNPSYSQIIERNIAGALSGVSVASAGDVNADGYGDVIVGASGYTNGHTSEGSLALYFGSPLGLQTPPAYTYESNSDGARFGEKVAPCGDINNDGYADFAAGATLYGANNEGRVYVFAGNATGATLIYVKTGNAGDNLAQVAGNGDVDGDGYPELVMGAPGGTSGQSGEGLIHLYYGNRHSTTEFGVGLDRRLHMRQPDDSDPLALLGRSDSETEFRFRALGRTAFGRGRIKTEWEATRLGITWTGASSATDWLDTGSPIPGQGSRGAVNQLVTRLDPDTPYHFRVRYHGESPFFPSTPWFSLPGNSPLEADFRTSGGTTDALDVAVAMTGLRLDGVCPNPVAGASLVRFFLPEEAEVSLTLHDVAGRRVVTLAEGRLEAGTHSLEWDGRGVNGTQLIPGVYFARLEAEGRVDRAKVIVAPR